MNKFTILQWNCNNIQHRLGQLKSMVEIPDILGLTETHQPHPLPSHSLLPSYTYAQYNSPHNTELETKRRTSGVALFSNRPLHRADSIIGDCDDCVFAYSTLPNPNPHDRLPIRALIGVVYRRHNNREANAKLYGALQRAVNATLGSRSLRPSQPPSSITSEPFHLLIMGDFNARCGEKIGDPEINSQGKQLCEWCEQHDMAILNQILAYGQSTRHGVTRGNNPSHSILDIFITNNAAIYESITIDPPFKLDSDHLPILLSINLHHGFTNEHVPHKRWFIEEVKDWSKYTSTLDTRLQSTLTDFKHHCTNHHDPPTTVQYLHDILIGSIISVAHRMVPYRTVHRYHNGGNKEWWRSNETIRHLNTARHTAYRKFRRALNHHNGNRSYIAHLLNASKRANRAFRSAWQRAADDHFSQQCDKLEVDRQLQWSIFSSMIPTPRASPVGIVDEHGQLPLTLHHSLNHLTSHYAKTSGRVSDAGKGEILINKCTDCLDDRKIAPSLSAENSFTEEMVMDAFMQSPLKTALGGDLISPYFLRHLPPIGITMFTLLFNYSWQFAVLPIEWLSSNIYTLYKGQQKPTTAADSFRPVSLTSIIIKSFERMIHRLLYATIETSIHPSQAGFRPGYSCEDQLYQLQSRIVEYTNQTHDHLTVAFIDLKNAFDRVWHDGLMYKLYRMGCNRNPYLWKWIRSFLSNRRIRVIYGGSHADWYPIYSGVPQGAVLSPLLFLAYINDLPDYCPTADIALFADDISLSGKRQLTSSATNTTRNRPRRSTANYGVEWDTSNKKPKRKRRSSTHIIHQVSKRTTHSIPNSAPTTIADNLPQCDTKTHSLSTIGAYGFLGAYHVHGDHTDASSPPLLSNTLIPAQHHTKDGLTHTARTQSTLHRSIISRALHLRSKLEYAGLPWPNPQIKRNTMDDNLQHALGGVSRWCSDWHMVIGFNKSKTLYFRRSHRSSISLDAIQKSQRFLLCGQPLDWSSFYKYLGITFEYNLKWKRHTMDIITQIRHKARYISRLCHPRRPPHLRTITTLVKSHLLSVIAYGLHIWTPTKTDTQRLESAYARPLRFALGLPSSAHIQSILGTSGIVDFKALRDAAILRFFKRIKHLPSSHPSHILLNKHIRHRDDNDKPKYPLIDSYRTALLRCITTEDRQHQPLSFTSLANTLDFTSIARTTLLSSYNRWQSLQGRNTCADLRRFRKNGHNLPGISPFLLIDPKPVAVLRTRLLFNRSHIRHSESRRGISITDTCRRCGNGRDDIKHYLLDCTCPILMDIRRRHHSILEAINYSISVLLGEPTSQDIDHFLAHASPMIKHRRRRLDDVNHAAQLIKTFHPTSFILFTDGSAMGTHGPSAAAAVGNFPSPSPLANRMTLLINDDPTDGKRANGHWLHRTLQLPTSTNNVAELKAIDLAIDLITEFRLQDQHFPTSPIHIMTDSRYAHGVLCGIWKIKKNAKLIHSIRSRLTSIRNQGHAIDIHWIRGHAGIKGNEFADHLANHSARIQLPNSPPPSARTTARSPQVPTRSEIRHACRLHLIRLTAPYIHDLSNELSV